MMITFVASALVAALASSPFDAQGQPAGYIKIVEGTADVIRGGATITAHPGDAVYQNDALRTGANGRLGVTLKDDTRISLSANSEIGLSEFKFSPAEGRLGLVMKLLRGAAAFVTGRIARLRPDAVRIETPSTIVGVRGSHLAIRVEG